MTETVSEAVCLLLKGNRKGFRRLEKESSCFKGNGKMEQQENYSAVNIAQFMRIIKFIVTT